MGCASSKKKVDENSELNDPSMEGAVDELNDPSMEGAVDDAIAAVTRFFFLFLNASQLFFSHPLLGQRKSRYEDAPRSSTLKWYN